MLGASAVLIAGLCGCATEKSPVITVVGANLVESGENARVIAMELAIENPNPRPLELLEFRYRVKVPGSDSYEGRRRAIATLAANRTTRMTLPAVVSGDDSGPAAISGTLTYVSPGRFAEALFDTGVRKPKVSFGGEAVATSE